MLPNKLIKQIIPMTKDERKLAVSKAQEANEKIFKLVVKIISWGAGPMEGASIKTSNKITKEEWNKYRKHLLNISKIDSREKIMNKLKTIQSAIKNNNGFE